MQASNDDRCITLGGPSWLRPLIVVSPVILVLLLTNGLNVAAILSGSVPLPWSIVMVIGVAGAIFVLPMVIIRFLYPPVRLNDGSALIRAGRHTSAYSEVTTALLLVSASKTRRNLNLLLRSANGLRAVILVRDAKERTLPPEAAALVCDLIRDTNIAMPLSSADPKGKFARYNFPNNVTKEDALHLIEHPPTFHDPLPIPPRV